MGDKTAAQRLFALLKPIVLSMALAALAALALPEARAQGPEKSAHVVVEFGDGRVVVRPITFTGEISGLTALGLAGLDVVSDNGAVCAIEGTGCPASDCFCPDNWWQQSYWMDGAWQDPGWPPALITAANAVDGWAWGTTWPTVPPPAPSLTAASAALEWLRPRQSNADGGYGDPGSTVETLLAVAADGYDAAEWRRLAQSPSLGTYLSGRGAAYANSSAGAAGKLAVGLAAGDGCWPIGAMRPLDYYSSTTGIFGASFGSGLQAWAILGTHALSQVVPASAIGVLKSAQQGDGGWEWSPGWGSDTNSTALAMQALIAAGEPTTAPAVISSLNFLDAAQNDDGGFPYASPDTSDVNSTAYVVQALLAAGQDPLSGAWVISGSNPISYLLAMQLPDGSFEWQPGGGANESATRQAVPALLGQPFPLEVATLADCRVSYLPVILKNKE
jgi:hypothetical protein